MLPKFLPKKFESYVKLINFAAEINLTFIELTY